MFSILTTRFCDILVFPPSAIKWKKDTNKVYGYKMIEMKGEEVDKPASESNIENNNSTSPMEGINEVNIQNNPDIDKEDTSLLSIKQESASICCDGDEEQRSQEGRDPAEAAQMSPVETATLFLLSRIALFNKVMCLQNSTSFCIVFHPHSSLSFLSNYVMLNISMGSYNV